MVDDPVAFADHAAVIPPGDLARLMELFPEGRASMWGVVPGRNDVNVGRYRRVEAGDLVTFARQSRFFACGTVARPMRNAGLAQALWGRDAAGQTWECMYVLDEIRPLDIPFSEVNAAVGDAPRYRQNRFRVMSEEKSRAFLQHFPLLSERHIPPTSTAEYADALATLTGDLDRRVEASQRVEQARLRGMLFRGPVALCDLCGREFEIEFLVAAHIKRRAACSDFERRDVSHVVMAACKFGCDELFERGYITVTGGGALLLSTALQTGSEAHFYAAEHLVGKTFGRPVAGREDYFDWHRTHAYRG
jgi:hypothetical protein